MAHFPSDYLTPTRESVFFHRVGETPPYDRFLIDSSAESFAPDVECSFGVAQSSDASRQITILPTAAVGERPGPTLSSSVVHAIGKSTQGWRRRLSEWRLSLLRQGLLELLLGAPTSLPAVDWSDQMTAPRTRSRERPSVRRCQFWSDKRRGPRLLFRQTWLAYSEASAVGVTAMRASDGGARTAKRRGPASPLDRRSNPLA